MVLVCAHAHVSPDPRRPSQMNRTMRNRYKYEALLSEMFCSAPPAVRPEDETFTRDAGDYASINTDVRANCP